MLKLKIYEVFIRTIPEGLLFILAGYIFSNTRLNIKRWAASSILLGVIVYLVRLLPINFGVHIIINLMIHIFLLVKINKIDVFMSIATSLISVIAMLVSEWINFLVLDKMFYIGVEEVLKNNFIKQLYFIPSLFIFLLIVLSVYYIKDFIRKNKGKV